MNTQEIKDATIKAKYDQYLDKASWLNQDPSPEVLSHTKDMTQQMIINMWLEYLAFTEGIAIDVYGIDPIDMLDHMGSMELTAGFCAYLQGALDVAKEETKE